MSKMNSFIDKLMKKMTLDEKIGQLNLLTPGGNAVTGAVVNDNVEGKIRDGLVGGMFGTGELDNVIKIQEMAMTTSRLKIPLLFGSDVIHGYKTVFPVPLGLSCSWDMKLIEQSARIAAVEATANGLKWTFSPMVDISRDARWGRAAEGSGEDPFLGARVAEAMVKGYQGDDLSRHDTMMACMKHFALYGAAEAGRDYNTVDMSEMRMREAYLPPFKAAVKAGVGSVMAAFNDVNGVAATADKRMLTGILRKEWGFKGFVVSDYTGINEMTAHGHGDLQTVSARALKAGLDMDMVGEGFLTTLKQSLAEGKIKESDIDAACRRILEAKWKLGLFADPYKCFDQARRAAVVLCPEHRAAARTIAAKSCVLLKNDNSVLPLKKSGTIALIGPLADDKANMAGTWAVHGESKHSVGVLEGVKALVGDSAKILHCKGANITDDPELAKKANVFHDALVGEIAPIDPRDPKIMRREAVAMAKKADVVVLVVGEAKEMSGECSSRTDLSIPESQRALIAAVKKTGKPLVLVTMSGRPLTMEYEDKTADAILHTWHAGTEAGNAIADVLFGDVNPGGKLTMTFPRNVGQLPIYYAHRTTGRPWPGHFEKFKTAYLDVSNAPLYAFGHGLSYTTFDYGPVQVSKAKLAGKKDSLTASVTVKNTGAVAGEEVVQMYISDPVATSTRPVQELKGFEKIMLQPGEERTVSFEITPKLLKYWNAGLKHDWEGGEFIIRIGTSSDKTQSASVQWDRHAPKTSAAAEQKNQP